MIRKLGLMAFLAVGMSAGAASLAPSELLAAAVKSKTLPEASAWRIDFSVVNGIKDSGWDVQSITSTRMGDVQRDVILWRDGRTSEAWWMRGGYLANDSRTDAMLYSREKKPLSLLGWIAWIDEKNFRGVEKRDDGEYGIFAAKVPWSVYWPGYFIMESGGPPLDAEALFSPLDGRLVSVRYDNMIGRITWLAAPVEALVPPEKFIRKQQIISERIAKKSRNKRGSD